MAGYRNDNMFETFRRKDQLGSVFEQDFIDMLKCRFKTVKDMRSSKDDKEQGTDIILNSVRMDITMNFAQKDWMPFSFETDIPATITDNIKIGVRHGNSHKGYTEFKEPVIVIGVDMEPYTYRLYEDEILDNIDKNIDNILIAATDAIQDYTTTDKEERKELFDTPLRKNKNYKPPRHLGTKYKMLNDQQIEEKYNRLAAEYNNRQPAADTSYEKGF